MTCKGNGTEYCGGGSRLNVYSGNATTDGGTGTPPPVPSGPVVRASIGDFKYRRCVTEAPGRALSGKAVASDDMTVAYCAGNCTDFTYMGVEYGRGKSFDATVLVLY